MPAHRDAAQPARTGRRALLTYTWGGFTLVPLGGSADTVKLIDDVVFALGAVALLVAATLRRPRP